MTDGGEQGCTLWAAFLHAALHATGLAPPPLSLSTRVPSLQSGIDFLFHIGNLGGSGVRRDGVEWGWGGVEGTETGPEGKLLGPIFRS